MISVILAALLQASGPVAEPPTAAPNDGATQTSETKAKPKMVCRYEHDTGTRVKRVKVCHEQGVEEQEDKTALQRALDKQGDVLTPRDNVGNR